MNEISQKVLCVDDEPNVLAGLQRQLRGRFDVAVAPGAQAGLEALRQQGPFAVVVTDYKMPEMNGVEFLREVSRLAPHTVGIMLTGHADINVAVAALHEGRIFRFLSKPCRREVLETAVRDSLEQHRLMMSERRLTAALNQANEDLRQLNQKLEERVQQRTATIARMHDFVSGLSGCGTLEDAVDLVVRVTAEALCSGRVSLLLPEPSGEYLRVAAALGIPQETQDRIRVPIGAPIAGRVFAEGRRIVVNTADDELIHNERYDSDFFAVVPLVSTALTTSGRAVGVLNVTERYGGKAYGEEDLATLQTIAESAAVAIQNHIRLRERNEARDAIILALAKLAEHRDPETGAHIERVRSYCRLLSETLGQTAKYAAQIDQEFISTIYRSSPLHDIGKVGIPDRILLKPGRLTPEEFEIMKTHTTIGGNTLRAIVHPRRRQPFLEMGMQIAYHHHEKYNGTGYPTGLAGGAIPLCARVLAVADVYDALISQRVYKAAMSHAQATDIIHEGSGQHFDPDVAAAFRDRQAEFQRVAAELRDKAEPTVALGNGLPVLAER
jgi:response regulator RpfG family c-di-GMP phosphodiesterase